MIQAIGPRVVAVPGTLVRATEALTDPGAHVSCHGILFQALPTNVGAVYLGGPALDRAALTDTFAVLPAPSDAFLPTFSIALTIAPNALALQEFWVDADTADDGVLVTILVA